VQRTNRFLLIVALAALPFAAAMVYGLTAVFGAPAIGVKRLHDINKSGWWLLLFYLVPAVCLGIEQLTVVPHSTRALLLTFLFLPVAVWAFIELGCRRGTRGPNKYGVDPDRTAVLSTPPAN